MVYYKNLALVAVVEVQRYWNRFVQLGGNSLGVIDLPALDSGELTQDVIIKNVNFINNFLIFEDFMDSIKNFN